MMNRQQKDVSLSEVHGSIDTTTRKGSWWRQLFVFFGPAYLVSVGYMDPGNWATDLAGGSRFGYSLLWVLLMSNLIAILLQNSILRPMLDNNLENIVYIALKSHLAVRIATVIED